MLASIGRSGRWRLLTCRGVIRIPGIFEGPSNLKELKTYLGSLKGRTMITFEESGTAHWLYLQLVDEADRVLICDPFQNPAFGGTLSWPEDG